MPVAGKGKDVLCGGVAPEDVPTGARCMYECRQCLCSWARWATPAHSSIICPHCLVFSLTSASELNFQKVKIARNYTAFDSPQALL